MVPGPPVGGTSSERPPPHRPRELPPRGSSEPQGRHSRHAFARARSPGRTLRWGFSEPLHRARPTERPRVGSSSEETAQSPSPRDPAASSSEEAIRNPSPGHPPHSSSEEHQGGPPGHPPRPLLGGAPEAVSTGRPSPARLLGASPGDLPERAHRRCHRGIVQTESPRALCPRRGPTERPPGRLLLGGSCPEPLAERPFAAPPRREQHRGPSRGVPLSPPSSEREVRITPMGCKPGSFSSERPPGLHPTPKPLPGQAPRSLLRERLHGRHHPPLTEASPCWRFLGTSFRVTLPGHLDRGPLRRPSGPSASLESNSRRGSSEPRHGEPSRARPVRTAHRQGCREGLG